MSRKHLRLFGTTPDAIDRAEARLGRALPPSLRAWLLANNGRSVEGVTVFPVLDDRDPRSTWDSIDRRFQEGWAEWLANFDDEGRDFSHLLPFADYGTGDYYCLDYSVRDAADEPRVVRWSHETGEAEWRADSFGEFLKKLKAGAFRQD